MKQIFILTVILLVQFTVCQPILTDTETGSEPEILIGNRHNHTLVFAHIVSNRIVYHL